MKKLSKYKEDVLLKDLQEMKKEHILPKKYIAILQDFYISYMEKIPEDYKKRKRHVYLFHTFFEILKKLAKHPFTFEPYHKKIRKPFDYYAYGLDFLRPLVIKEKSKILGKERIKKIISYLDNNENVVFLSNHQTESDPHAISLLLEDEFSSLAEKIIYVAGERVTTDLLAIPFSLGCDLLCIYSKKYIEHPPEKKIEKQHHNTKTMHIMASLLKEGGKVIYVAPSGGRDRRNSKGEIEIAPFDPQSIEIFNLMARRSKQKTHFYPLALETYKLMPPPETRVIEMGENRIINRCPISMAIGEEIDMEKFPGSDVKDKKTKKINRARYIQSIVEKDYKKLI